MDIASIAPATEKISPVPVATISSSNSGNGCNSVVA